MKKKLLSILMIAAMLLSSVMSVLAYNTGDDYPNKYKNAPKDSIVDEWNFYNRQCTSFVAWCLNSRNGVNFTNQYAGAAKWGDASTWGTVAQNLGITVNKTPAVGAVVWWSSGHVAWVESVSGNNVIIEEYNNYYDGNYNRRTISANNPTGYIHIKDISTPASPSAPAKYTVTFNANGGTTPTASKTVTANSTYGDLPTPSRDDFRFDGWYDAVSGGNKYASNTTVKITSNQTLYAHWTPIPPSGLSISANYTTIPVGDNVTFTYGVTAARQRSIAISKGGSNYATVALNSNSGTGAYKFNEKGTYSCVLESSNNAGSAKSSAVMINVVDRDYPVTFNANGGNNAPANQTKTFWEVLTLTSDKPTRRGWVFNGWNTKADGSGTAFASGATYNKNEALTLYAQWTPAVPVVSDVEDKTYTEKEITPTLEIKDGNDTLVQNTDYTLAYENNINVGTAKIKVTYTGDYAASQGAEKSFNILQATPVIQTKPMEKEVPVGASLWQCEIGPGVVIGVNNGNEITGTYSWKGITKDNDEIFEERGVYERTIVFTPDNENYKAIEFKTNIKIYKSGHATVYRVTFDSNGGSEVWSQSTAGTVREPEAPTKKGYTFDGWYSDAQLTREYNFSKKVLKNMTLYAKWVKSTEKDDKDIDNEQNRDDKEDKKEDKKEENNQIILKIGQKRATVFGETKTNDVAPIVRNDRTMLPARFVAESLGADVYWDGVKHEVKIVSGDGDITILLYIGSKTAYVNGKAVTLDSPAFVENDRTYTPIRFIVENLGANVEWDGENLQVIITK